MVTLIHPRYNIVIKAETQEEAQEKLKKAIENLKNPKKTKSKTK